MDSSVKARPNYYEILGVSPSATAAEIARAFARKMSAFAARPVAAAAELSIAFETLRDPEKRQAYDASLRPPAPPQLGYSVRWNSVPLPGPALAAAPQPRPQPVSAEEKPAPFIASTPTPEPHAEPVRPVAQQSEPRPQSAPTIKPIATPQAEDSPIGWSRTAMLVGGAVVGVGVLGAVAGWSSGLVEQPQPPEARVALPRAKAPTAVAAAAPAPAWLAERARTQRPGQPVHRIGRSAPAPQSIAAEDLQTETSQAALNLSGSASAEVQPATVVPASLSIPNPVIARTIGRIGYACGEVASTAPVEGGRPGVFKVTCTSGHSYQATPVRGRYHFRRLSNR